MMKFFSLLILFGVHICLAQETPGKLQLSLTGGYQQNNLRWSIAGNANGQNPNILSELRWQAVGGPATGMHIQFRLFDRWLLAGEYAHTFFTAGIGADTDYGSNNRTNPVYAQQFNANKGGADHWLAGLGFQLPLTKSFSVTPSAGYGQFHQSLYLTGNTTPLSDLNSTYKTTWCGPYGKILCATQFTSKLGLNAGVQYNQVRYKASANWNLIREFSHPESFRHTANGYGLNLHATALYRISNMHSIGIIGIYSRWQTGRGIDELYLASGESEQTQLNEVRSTNWQVLLEWRIALLP